MTTYLLRPGRRGDLPAVRSLSRAIRRELRVDLPVMREGFCPEHGELWVVEAGRGAIVGSCGLREGEGGHWELHSLNLMPEWRGFGLGRALVEHAIFSAQEQGALSVAVWVHHELAEAAAFLSRLGFVATTPATPDSPMRFVRGLALSH